MAEFSVFEISLDGKKSPHTPPCETVCHFFDFFFHLKARFRFLQAANQNEYTCQYIPIGNSY
jgi:hypothetical protein